MKNIKEFKKLIKEKQYYDAHEVLEEIWFPIRKTKTNYCLVLKGFINGAVSLELFKRGKIEQSKKIHQNYLKYTKDSMINMLEDSYKWEELKIFMDNEFLVIKEQNMKNIITSIDLGSNSFRVLKYDCISKTSIKEFETTVGTADGLSKSGDISQYALSRIITAIKTSIDIVDYNPKEAIAVTTQALRVANNSKEILKSINLQTGVDFKIIDGQTEAKLTLLAMQYALKREKLKDDNFILLDIGGGSTELIFYKNNKSIIKSFSYGIVTLSQSKNIENDFKKFEDEVLEFISSSNIDINNSIFLSTAGTPTTVAALKQGLNYETYDKTIVNGTTLTLKEVKDIQLKLNSFSKDELIKEVGTGREDYINTGMLIYQLFFKTLNKKISIVFDDGLREGVAIDCCIKKAIF